MSLLLDALKEAAKGRKEAERVDDPAPPQEERLALDLDPEPGPQPGLTTESPKSISPEVSVTSDSDPVSNSQRATDFAGSASEEKLQDTDASQNKTVKDKETLTLTPLAEGSFSSQSSPAAERHEDLAHPHHNQGRNLATNVFQNRVKPSPLVRYGIPIVLVLLGFFVVTGAVLYLNGDWSTGSPKLPNQQGGWEDDSLEKSVMGSTGVTNNEIVSTNLESAREIEGSALQESSKGQLAVSPSINLNNSKVNDGTLIEKQEVINSITEESTEQEIGSTGVLISDKNPSVASQADRYMAARENMRPGNYGNEAGRDLSGDTTETVASGIKISKRQMPDYALRERSIIERALQQGDMDLAEEGYRRVLKLKSDDVSAMVGLANILSNRGLLAQAKNAYFSVLNKNPENLFAKVGLINIEAMDSSNLAAGSQLKQLLVDYPDQHILHASLGSFYVRRNNWPAAQAAYFEALSLDSENPDYAFNLAVSLDQMNKPEIAVRYYRRALELLSKQAAGFSESDIRRRLQELSKVLP